MKPFVSVSYSQELVESRDREMVSWETELSQCNDHLRQLAPQGHRGVSGRPTSQDEDNESSAEQHRQLSLSHGRLVKVRCDKAVESKVWQGKARVTYHD